MAYPAGEAEKPIQAALEGLGSADSCQFRGRLQANSQSEQNGKLDFPVSTIPGEVHGSRNAQDTPVRAVASRRWIWWRRADRNLKPTVPKTTYDLKPIGTLKISRYNTAPYREVWEHQVEWCSHQLRRAFVRNHLILGCFLVAVSGLEPPTYGL